MKILITDRLPENVVKRFKARKDVAIDLKPELGAGDRAELEAELPGYDALIVRSQTKVTADLIRAGRNLKVIGRAGVGIDNIDVPEATRAGILVMHTPEGNIRSAAEHTMAMMLALVRNIPQATIAMRAGLWEKKKFVGTELYGKTLGITGFGRIGRLVAERARAFGMTIVVYDPYVTPEKAKELGVKPLSFNDLLRRSDIVTIHASLTKETTHLFSYGAFAAMKKGAFLVNCSRGELIDEKALHKALSEGRIGGAALDVFEEEPARDNPLLGLPQVIATPHVAGSTYESEENTAIAIITHVIDFLTTGVITNAVNIVSPDTRNFDLVRPYLELAEKMGVFATKFLGATPHVLEVCYAGEISEAETKLITHALLKGILMPSVGERVNIVNASLLAGDQGIKLSESATRDAEDYRSVITLDVGVGSKNHVLSGTILGKTQPVFVRLDGFRIEAIPSSRMLIFKNKDQPGVVGKVGTILGNHGINIADIRLSRVSDEKTAVAVVSVDSDVQATVLAELRTLPEMIEVQFLEL